MRAALFKNQPINSNHNPEVHAPAKKLSTPNAISVHANSCPASDAQRVFPERLSKPLLPAADRLARAIAYEHGGSISTQVHLCVRPDGEIGDITLLMTSGMDDFDRAVVDGISDWQYASFKAPKDTRVCENLTVSYVTR